MMEWDLLVELSRDLKERLIEMMKALDLVEYRKHD